MLKARAAARHSDQQKMQRAVLQWQFLTQRVSQQDASLVRLQRSHGQRLRGNCFSAWWGVVAARRRKIDVAVACCRLLESALVMRRVLMAWHRLCRFVPYQRWASACPQLAVRLPR